MMQAPEIDASSMSPKALRATVLAALVAAKAAPFTPGRPSGCGRAYVAISAAQREIVNAVAAGCKALGLIFQRKGHRGMRNVIYIGYDNGTARELARAQAFAASLSAAGIPAYDEAQED